MFTVYVLHSATFNKIYIGMTSDMPERFKSHNELGKKGWTKKFRPWVILYAEEYADKFTALKREKELKTASGRIFIKSLIKTD